MKTRMTRRKWLMGAGAGTLLLVGGLIAGPVASLAQGDPEAAISKDQATQIATEQFPGTSATDVELEAEDGRPVYEVTLSNGTEVEVDGDTGAILETEQADGSDEADDDNGTEGNDD